MTDLEQYFKEYKNLMMHLSTLFECWTTSYSLLEDQVFRENVLKEKLADQEKEELDKKITDLEFQIKNCENSIINIINKIKRTLERRLYYSLSVINSINQEHIEAMKYYDRLIDDYKEAMIRFGKHNINISFVKLEQSKLKLNTSIKDFNEKMILAHNIGARLIDTNEALSTAKRKEFERLKEELKKENIV